MALTLLFNLSLDHRALYTTFYSNTLSGVAELTGLGDLYPIVASLCLIGAILAVVPRLPMFQALLMATSTFCVVATTPEPQFIPVLLYVAVAGSLGRLEDEGSFEASPS